MTMPPRLRPNALACALLAAALLAACGPSPPPAPPPSPPPVAMPPPAPATPPAPPPEPVVVMPDMNLADGPIYRCEIVGGDATPITYDPKVESLCRRHPEMGPCQFERDACRARGGRVYTSAGEEVTTAVEKKYDERVRRVRFQADGTVSAK